ncbi:unnamed protein product, partial [Rodentolepis nana]|uniref:AAA_5 domain-containing protein n=1 Tax=Rodentolepis nana TaxID=102285 RepID=A0A0R3TF04_RODNA
SLDDNVPDDLSIDKLAGQNSFYSIQAPDLSLNSWLQCLPESTFIQPFEPCRLNLAIHRLRKPSQESGLWADQILREPSVKPLIFPYTHLPPQTTASQILSQSLMRSNIRPNLAQSLLQGPGRSKTFLGMAASSLVSRNGVIFRALSSLVILAGKRVIYSLDTEGCMLGNFNRNV